MVAILISKALPIVWVIKLVLKILKIGTPKVVSFIFLKMEQFVFSVQ